MDVVALGELQKMVLVARETHCLRQIREGHHAMFWQC